MAVPEAAKSSITLRDVVPYWVKRRAPNKNAMAQTERSLVRWEAAVGLVPLHEITKADGAKFVDYLLDATRGFGHKTASDTASAINALANVAVRADLMERNPLDLGIDKTIGASRRVPWTDEELKRLFGHRLFSKDWQSVPAWQNVSPTDGRAVLLLMLHTGARLGEIAQLRACDFQTHGGIQSVRITEEAGSVKTMDSNRTIPLAAHLLADQWFEGWLASLAPQGDAPAFPSLSRAKAKPVDPLAKWFGDFRRDCNLPSGKLNGTHKFRHWIRSALAAKGVGDAIADNITGHAAQGSAGRKVYTASASLPVMLEALDRLDWPKV